MVRDHSVWLRPTAQDMVWLEAAVKDLSGRFGAPFFEAHATIISDVKMSAEQLLELITPIAAKHAPLALKIESVEQTEAFFRSFYARLDKSAPIMALKADCLAAVNNGTLDEFMPHVSLAYGVDDSDLKRSELQRFDKALAGHTIRFDSMVIVSSSSDTPIEDWVVKYEVPFVA